MTDWTTPEDVPADTVDHLHRWLLQEGNPADAATPGERAVADIIHTFWPVPARTLADELAHITEVWETWTTDMITGALNAATTRAKQVERDRDDTRAEVKRERDLGDALAHERDDTRAELERVRDAVDPKGAGLPPGMTISEAVQTLVDGIPTGERMGLTDAQLKREYDLIEARAEVERVRSELAEVTNARDSLREDYDHARAEVERLDAVAEDYGRRATAALTERDEARAEVERLDAEVERLDGEVPQETPWQFIDDIRALLGKAPLNPADVKPGEAWVVECRGERRNAVKDHGYSLQWSTVNADGWPVVEDNEDITLITRLVPAPRVITNPDELDRLAEGAVILSLSTKYALQRVNAGDGWYCPATKGKATSTDVLSCGPVTVLWEPVA